jgi:hypothetical protein
MTSVPDLTYDIFYWIIQAVADTSAEGARDNTCVDTLLACCLVNSTWCRLAQPILNQTIIVNTQADLNRRILARSKDHLGSVQEIVFFETWKERFTFEFESIL